MTNSRIPQFGYGEEETSETIHQVEVAIVGNDQVGKSALIHRYLTNEYKANIRDYESKFYKKEVEYRGHTMLTRYKDSHDQSRFRTIANNSFTPKGMYAGIICFDPMQPDYLETIRLRLNEFNWSRQYNGSIQYYIFVGTKSDLDTEHGYHAKAAEEIKSAFADMPNWSVFSASAVTGENVNELFDSIHEHYFNHIKKEEILNSSEMKCMRDFFKSFRNTKKGFFHSRTKLEPGTATLVDIMKEATKVRVLGKAQSKEACVSLGWLTPEGQLTDLAPRVVSAAYETAIQQASQKQAKK